MPNEGLCPHSQGFRGALALQVRAVPSAWETPRLTGFRIGTKSVQHCCQQVTACRRVGGQCTPRGEAGFGGPRRPQGS